ncbi:gastric triacylglycerol lipase [Galendromus occidentalis]|uniref:Lipase n=1 Tax=Galendromus occidentalis TaxID=34638 RepID=A0AAJ6QVY0_9ACAR|nr:gastric triacylglycerol lipase [Galendromus occidentalis]
MLEAISVPLLILGAVSLTPQVARGTFLRGSNSSRYSHDPDADLNVTQIIARWGYPVENYEVITSDGYILQIQRIPHGIKNSTTGDRVAFLQHGLFSSAFDYVNNLPSESLGYVMADNGYDVWLGNVRGNTYSRRHVNMSADSKKFWEFTFDEFIDFDVPAMIDFVLNKTGKESLYYVGHSQGTIVMFGLLSTRMEYQKKIKAFAAMGPVTNVTSITSPVRYIAPFAHDIDFIIEFLGSGEFGNQNPFFKAMADTVCSFAVTRDLCEDAIFVVCGIDSNQLNVTRIPVYVSHTPAGTSVRNVNHFAQEVEAGRFQKYDFGVKENKRRYGQPAPPEYDVRNIHETPVALFWSANDWLADPKDVAILVQRLPSIVESYEVPERQFTHVDFILGVSAKRLVYDPMMEFLSKY